MYILDMSAKEVGRRVRLEQRSAAVAAVTAVSAVPGHSQRRRGIAATVHRVSQQNDPSPQPALLLHSRHAEVPVWLPARAHGTSQGGSPVNVD